MKTWLPFLKKTSTGIKIMKTWISQRIWGDKTGRGSTYFPSHRRSFFPPCCSWQVHFHRYFGLYLEEIGGEDNLPIQKSLPSLEVMLTNHIVLELSQYQMKAKNYIGCYIFLGRELQRTWSVENTTTPCTSFSCSLHQQSDYIAHRITGFTITASYPC